jgi:dienelactone hydrolase
VEFLPESAGQVTAILAIPGCSGISLDSPATDRGGGSPTDPYFRRHYPAISKILRSEGFGVFLLDYHSAEGIVSACQGEISTARIAEYVVAAATKVVEHERVDSGRVFVIGWSLGGAGLLRSLDALVEQSVPVSATFAIYPGCGSASPWQSDFPVHFFLGEADDITSAETCRHLAAEASQSTPVSVTVYPGAHHGFDIVDAPAEISTGRGTTVGYNEAAANDTWARIREVLSGG